MNQYGVLFETFWTGETGKAIRRVGGKDAQLLALYLISSPHANMLGLYHLPMMYVAVETGLTKNTAAKAFSALAHDEVRYGEYDQATEFVWVREMARFRMGLSQPDAKPLDKEDNRVKGANRLYGQLTANPFLGPFFDRYQKLLHLQQRREGPQLIALTRGLEGASKGLGSQ
jgi:hypothetical protein